MGYLIIGCLVVLIVSLWFARSNVLRVWARPGYLLVFGASPLTIPSSLIATVLFGGVFWVSREHLNTEWSVWATLLLSVSGIMATSYAAIPMQIDLRQSRVRWGSFGWFAGWKSMAALTVYAAPKNGILPELRLSGEYDSEPFDIVLANMGPQRLERVVATINKEHK